MFVPYTYIYIERKTLTHIFVYIYVPVDRSVLVTCTWAQNMMLMTHLGTTVELKEQMHVTLAA